MAPRRGFTHSPETRAKMSAARKGKPHSEEWRRKIRDALRAHWDARPTLSEAEIARRNIQCKRRRMLRGYGLTEADFNAMRDRQGGLCAICYQAPKDTLCVDHSHETGKVRGLLCRRCNLVIGNAGESRATLQRAARYLGNHEQDR